MTTDSRSVPRRQVEEQHLVPYDILHHADGLETSTLGLHIPLRPRTLRSVDWGRDQAHAGCLALFLVSYIASRHKNPFIRMREIDKENFVQSFVAISSSILSCQKIRGGDVSLNEVG